MRYAIQGLRHGKYVFLAHSEGRHAQEAILKFRKATGIGGKMRAELSSVNPAPIPVRTGIETTLNIDLNSYKAVEAKYHKATPEAPPSLLGKGAKDAEWGKRRMEVAEAWWNHRDHTNAICDKHHIHID